MSPASEIYGNNQCRLASGGKKVAPHGKQSGFSKLNLLASVCLFGLGLAFAVYTQAGKIRPVELSTLSGGSVELPGKGLSWVNFWSITCPPCLKEMPYLETLHKEYQEEGKVQIVAVSVHYDPPNVIKEYRDKEGFTLPMAMDLDGLALQQFTDKLVVPSHYLVDANGKILLEHLGEIDEAGIRKAIEQHL